MDEITNDVRRTEAATLKTYRELEARLLDALARVRVVLKALGHTAQAADGAPSPIIDDVRTFLRERGEPTRSSEIIATVGDRRKRRYPQLLRPFGDIWKSLQFHDKHSREIVCVEYDKRRVLRRGKLKLRAKQKPQPGGKVDSAAFYAEPDNLFWFVDGVKQ